MASDTVIFLLQDGNEVEPVSFCRSNSPSVRLRRDAIMCACGRFEIPEASSPMLTSLLWGNRFRPRPSARAWHRVKRPRGSRAGSCC